MSLPIDEMLLELRSALEAFAENPDDYTFGAVQMQTFRIESACEDMIVEGE